LTALLALFDLDGTLFLTHDPLSGIALVETLEQVYGLEVAADAPANVEHRGLTGSGSRGAFGCEAEERSVLLELAHHRAGDWPAEAAAEIGDTPEDVATAKEAGFRSIAVSSPRTRDRSELAGADVIVDDMDGIVWALLNHGR
jgi:phosphoglycolate phosphatase-like HAD superfamily hydrolase